MKVRFTVSSEIDLDVDLEDLEDPETDAVMAAWNKMRSDSSHLLVDALMMGKWSEPYEFAPPITFKLQAAAADGALAGVIGLSDEQVYALLDGEVVVVRGGVDHAAATRAAQALSEHNPDAMLMVFPATAEVVTLEALEEGST